MSEHEINLLLRGLKFCPTPQKSNTEQNTKDMDDFCRRLRLQEFFVDKRLPEKSWIHKKSNFEPNSGRNKQLDTCVDFLKELSNINKDNLVKKKFNISLNEKQS